MKITIETDKLNSTAAKAKLLELLKLIEADKPEEPEKPVEPAGKVIEHGVYQKKYKDGRAIYRFSKNMNQYPAKFAVVTAAGSKWIVTNDGKRYEAGKFLAKQSPYSAYKFTVLIPKPLGRPALWLETI